ncbi:hypothetical protein SLEP1_g59017 [Rubroshorea leprosula]|uniref:Uncharacterized protein n=1 Tax=Rubroshorea leprosula TaxID=152421 RepID=A0AAV5MR77_9ROSI|nr:hypothetical protein SLEP1_g59017 [Rubroshorea leprosula]
MLEAAIGGVAAAAREETAIRGSSFLHQFPPSKPFLLHFSLSPQIVLYGCMPSCDDFWLLARWIVAVLFCYLLLKESEESIEMETQMIAKGSRGRRNWGLRKRRRFGRDSNFSLGGRTDAHFTVCIYTIYRSVDRGSSILVYELLARDSYARCMYQLGPRVFDRNADQCLTKTMTQLLFF